MAHSLLANLPAGQGLFSAFFAVLVYAFFGTAQHVVLGTNAVTSIMVGDVVPCDAQLSVTQKHILMGLLVVQNKLQSNIKNIFRALYTQHHSKIVKLCDAVGRHITEIIPIYSKSDFL